MYSRKHKRTRRGSHKRSRRGSHRQSYRRFRGGNPILDLGNNINDAVTDLTAQANAHPQVKKLNKSFEISNTFLNDMKNTLGDNDQEKFEKAKKLHDTLTKKIEETKAKHKKVIDKQKEEINKLRIKSKEQEAIMQNLSSKPPLVKANTTNINPKPSKPPLVKAKTMPLKAKPVPVNSKPVPVNSKPVPAKPM